MTQETTASDMHQQGIDAYRVGEYEEALEAFGQARDYSAVTGDREGESEALGSMGVVCIELERWDDALRFLGAAADICEETGDQVNRGKVLGNLGMMYARQGDSEHATEAYEQALAIFRDLGEHGYEKDVARQLNKLTKESQLSDALGGFREGLAHRWEATGAPMMARKLFRLFGRRAGPADLDEEQDGDIVDLLSEEEQE
jgi:tetratricopeptide (TPR) repeat protein